MVFSAQLAEGGGVHCSPTLFHSIYIHDLSTLIPSTLSPARLVRYTWYTCSLPHRPSPLLSGDTRTCIHPYMDERKWRMSESGEYWMSYRGPGFLGSYDSAPLHLLPPPLLQSVSLNGNSQEVWERETACWRESGRKGVGEESIIRLPESLALYKSFNTLCLSLTVGLNTQHRLFIYPLNATTL